MKRVKFTENISKFILKMIAGGEKPILDFVKRSDEEQARMFAKGLSKCDGIKIKSAHQTGSAADIYFIVNGKMDMDKKRYTKWHDIWTAKYDGKRIIDWDICHFE